MKTLVIGSGGREHALALSLSQDEGAEVHAAPGNPGIAAVATLHDVDPMDGPAIAALATDLGVDLVVVGPEVPLVAGVADPVREAGISCFGPSRAAALLEGSKAFSKEVMAAAGVPTAGSRTCETPDEVAAALDAFGPPYVVKDDSLAAGKGVVVTGDLDEALAHAASCSRVVVEEFLDGPEFSLFVVCDGTRGVPLLPAQDFKRIHDGGRGPNTGGMGSYAPLSWLPEDVVEVVMTRVVDPTLAEMRERGAPFVGCLYVGLALTADGPKVIEFNCRFGDPDTQPVLALLSSPLGPLLKAAAVGDLTSVEPPSFVPGAAVTVVMASAGYPEGSSKGDVIVGTETLTKEPDVDVIHAGTARTEAGLVTAGGRVLAVRAVGADVADARAKAYEGIASISFPGAQWRRDIAAEPLGVVEGGDGSVTEERVSASGGTMNLLTDVVEPEPVDLSLLESLRVVPRGVDVRASGAGAHFEPGQVLAWQYAGWVDMLRVVRDDERGLVAWLPSGSERRVMIGEDGGGLRDRPVAERSRIRLRPARRTWSGHGILRIAPTGQPWSVWYFFEDDGTFGGHYVNLELTHERPSDGTPRIFSRDLVLDLWLDDEGVWLKDADELEAAVAAGRFTPEQGAVIEAIGRQARAELLQPRAWPLDEDWESWRPPAEWDEPLKLLPGMGE